ncbi:hypothetical protein [Rhizorhabdus dicambivorans]|uniref:Uncharacterized protein n=1 Tax=Rhizorhabdus dicambivorans TaxID=1850238 RepID=A0A2A4G0R2_9SPHN|nr:hypothetical protein [Rhizorhabdus dicambivorans]ATE64802.1 hypothetical protein CMV14_10660 [Rhizorhabdus dicambivorans]PCE44079.1 hypothetical protein COO09_00045 [Rhizorhabdus dicambivorans]
MLSEYAAIYRRVFAFVRAMPLIAAVPLIVQLAQALLAHGGFVPVDRIETALLLFRLLNTLAMLVVMVHALRWWRFQGDRRRVRRMGLRVLVGVVVMMTIQLTDEYLFVSAGHLAAHLLGYGRAWLVPGAVLLWMLVSIPLYPWYVALITDDHELTFREAVRRIRAKWVACFLLVLSALAPLLIIGTTVRSLRMSLPYASPWQRPLEVVAMFLVPMLIMVTASAYLAVYRIAYRGNLPVD